MSRFNGVACWFGGATSCFTILLLSALGAMPLGCSGITMLAGIPAPIMHFAAGGLAGGVGAFVAYPFDYIKSQMQTEMGQTKYQNGLEAFFDTIQHNPMLLYKGVGVQVMGIVPEKGIKLGVNDVLRSCFIGYCGHFPLWGEIVAGSMAGVCQVLASSPLEVIKVGLQTSKMTQVSEVFQEVGGVKGLFRGAEACILRDVLFTAICFPLYQHTNTILPPFVAGAMAGMTGAFFATPPDFIKTRILSLDACMMEDDREKEPTKRSILAIVTPQECELLTADYSTTFGDDLNERNPFVVADRIIKKEGISVMFSGVHERVLGSIPRFGTTLAVHDLLEQSMLAHGWIH